MIHVRVLMIRLEVVLHAELDQPRIERAVRRVLASGYRTADIVEPGTKKIGTAQMGDLVVAALA